MTSSLPVSQVVLMEDRAQVERRGQVQLAPGVSTVRVEGVSAVLVSRSLKVDAPGARVLESRVVRAWKEKPRGGLGADASELRKKVRELTEEQMARTQEAARVAARGELVARARADLLREMTEASGFGRVDGAAWSDQFRALAQSEQAIDEASLEVAAQLALTQRKLSEAQQALSLGERPEAEFSCALEIKLESKGAPVDLRASYLVPCALWRPAYRATLRGDQVWLECEAVVWNHSQEDWVNAELHFSTARPTLGTEPPALTEDVLRLRPKATEEKKVVSVQVREEIIQTSGEGGRAASEMPGLDDGGETVLLKAPAKASIPSDGQPHRVALSSFEAKATVERLCSAELTEAVSTVARFSNEGRHVLLAGPVDLLRQSGFVGRGQLKFAGVGETVALSFGSEDGMRVHRRHVPKTEEARLTGRRTTRNSIKLFISNAGELSTRLVLQERVPVSEVKEVEVQVLTRECRPAPSAVSKEGIARIELDCPPFSTQEVDFVWELSASAKVSGV